MWWDAALRSGQTFDEVIEKELRSAKAVVVLWSPRSVASRWVRAEATLADRRNKLVPAIIEACDRPIIFELTHAADLSDWTGDTSDSRWKTLVSDLRRLVDGQARTMHRLNQSLRSPLRNRSRFQWHPPPRSRRTATEPTGNPYRQMWTNCCSRRRASARPRFATLEPTQVEDEPTQFYKRSDDLRPQEVEKVHCLQRLDGELPETRFVVSPGGLKIGRTAPADIIVAGSGVSRAHCLVELAGDQLRVMDLNSTNGTYIDNERIGGAAVLAVGSILRVGNVSFEHEVRTRAEMELLSDPVGLNRGANPREARLARSS